jgi:hypothetical protein
MATIRQTIYSFVMHNPDCLVADIAAHIGKDLQATSKTVHLMKLAGMLTSDKIEGSPAHLWRITNRAVKFNTGETLRKAWYQRKKASNNMATIRMEIGELKAMLAKLEQTLA